MLYILFPLATRLATSFFPLFSLDKHGDKAVKPDPSLSLHTRTQTRNRAKRARGTRSHRRVPPSPPKPACSRGAAASEADLEATSSERVPIGEGNLLDSGTGRDGYGEKLEYVEEIMRKRRMCAGTMRLEKNSNHYLTFSHCSGLKPAWPSDAQIFTAHGITRELGGIRS